jgi:lipopolysaccharide export system permease protein
VIRRYDVPNRTMVDVTVQEYDGDRLARRIDARKGIRSGSDWVMVSGVERRFTGDGVESAAPFDSLRLSVPETPEDFAEDEVKPEQMSYFALRRYVERIRQSGGRPERLETDLHLRISFPLINFVILLIGSSLAVKVRRGGVAVGFGLSLAITFAYWSLIRAGQVLGQNGTLPPLLGAWLGNIVFFVVGAVLLRRTPK